MTGEAPPDTRTRILDGALHSVERLGLAKTSLEDVAQTAGVSRATIYRYFPGGRDQVITETVTWEVENFLDRIAGVVDELDTIEEKLQGALLIGHRAIGDHLLLQQLLSTEPQELFRELAEVGPLMRTAIAEYIAEQLRNERLQPGRRRRPGERLLLAAVPVLHRQPRRQRPGRPRRRGPHRRDPGARRRPRPVGSRLIGPLGRVR